MTVYIMLFLFVQPMGVVDSRLSNLAIMHFCHTISVLHILLGLWKLSTHAFLILQSGGHFMATLSLCVKFCCAMELPCFINFLMRGNVACMLPPYMQDLNRRETVNSHFVEFAFDGLTDSLCFPL